MHKANLFTYGSNPKVTYALDPEVLEDIVTWIKANIRHDEYMLVSRFNEIIKIESIFLAESILFSSGEDVLFFKLVFGL